MIKRDTFPIPPGVVEVKDEYQLNLCHYELLHLKPRGTIIFSGDPKPIEFQFFANPDRNDGIYARLETPMSPSVIRTLEYIERYPRTDCFVTITLLQFKMMFIAPRADYVYAAKHKTLHFNFPASILKTHRRKFIRIPFNDAFPAALTYSTDTGEETRKLRDLSREGMRLKISEKDEKYFRSGLRLKNAKLKLLNREIAVGVVVVAVYPGGYAGLRMIAMAEEDKTWLKEFIRTLMKQILNLPDPPFDDEIEKG